MARFELVNRKGLRLSHGMKQGCEMGNNNGSWFAERCC